MHQKGPRENQDMGARTKEKRNPLITLEFNKKDK